MRYGHFPTSGTKAKVRYAMYRQSFDVVSNDTMGFVKEEDIRKAANDALAVKSGTLEFVTKVARGDIKLKNEMDHIDDLRHLAIWQLGDLQFPRPQATKVLREIADGPDPTYAKEAAEVLRRRKDKE